MDTIIGKILDRLQEFYPVLAGYVIFAVFTVYLTIKVHGFYRRTAKVCDEFPSISDQLGALLRKFNSLIAVLAERQAIRNPEMFTIRSPLGLTETAYKVLTDIGWAGIISNEDSKKYLFAKLDSLGLRTKYDVEKASIVLMHELKGKTELTPFTPIKSYLYEHAEVDEESALVACAVSLRDKYLEAHPEISN